MSDLNVVMPEEIEFFAQSVKKFFVQDVGHKNWMECHEMFLKLNQQANIEASSHREEIVKEMLILHGKLPIIVHEAFCISVWRTKVLPRLIEIDPNPKATFMIYTVMFHEAIAISFLENMLFHENSCEALGETSLDLIDYCAISVTQLIGLINSGYNDDNKIDIEETALKEIERQKQDLGFKIGLKCLTILSYMVDKLDKLSLSCTTRLVKVFDIPCLISEVLHLKPWLRKNNGFEKFIDEKWVPVQGDAILKVTKTEAQTWFCLRQLLLNPNTMASYEINEFRQKQLARCQGLLNDQILDQLPPLVELKQFLCSLTVTGKGSKQSLILEEIPEIRDRIMDEARKVGWKMIADDQSKIFLTSQNDEICEMAKKLNAAYNTDLLAEFDTKNGDDGIVADHFCANCKKPALKKCSKCQVIYYCTRECQVANWLNHKETCAELNIQKT